MNNNSEYLVSAFQQGKAQAYASAQPYNSQMKKMYLTKVNEEDTICLYSDYAQPKMKLSLWSLKKLEEGWRNLEYEAQISSTIVFCGSWGEGSVILFGNPDQGIPEGYVCQYEPFDKNSLTTTKIDNLRNREVLLKDCIWWDSKSKKCLFEETGSELNNVATLYNLNSNRLEFYKNVPIGDEIHVLSHDQRYFVGYQAKLVSEEDPQIQGQTELHVMTFVKKKIWVVHLMRTAKITVAGKKENMLDYYGNIYIARDVAEMIGK